MASAPCIRLFEILVKNVHVVLDGRRIFSLARGDILSELQYAILIRRVDDDKGRYTCRSFSEFVRIPASHITKHPLIELELG